MITTNGLNHLALPVKDPERSAKFYAGLFNMEIQLSSPDVAFLATVGSDDLIALGRSDVEVVSSRNTMHFGFVVDPEQFDAAVRTIEEKSVKKVSEPSERKMGRYIFIEDPDGYTVEIFEHVTPLGG
jgi:lactoylglutathione lyase